MYINDLPNHLRSKPWNLWVTERPGWTTHNHGQLTAVRGVLLHHTAGPVKGDSPSLGTVVNGTKDIDGPLSQIFLSRAGEVIMVSSGLAYHAGKGVWAGIPRDQGNQYLIGIEAESTGRGDWTTAQLDVYPRLVAAILSRYQLTADRAIAHAEYAQPPGRKIDPAGWPGHFNGFRTQVDRILKNPQEGPMSTPQEIAAATLDMPLDEGADPKSLSAFVVMARRILVDHGRILGDVLKALDELKAKADVTNGGVTALSQAVDEIRQKLIVPLTFEETKEATKAGAGDAIAETPFRVNGVTLTPED